MTLPTIDRQQDVVAMLRQWRGPINRLLQRNLKLPAPYNFRASVPATTPTAILLEWLSDNRADGYEIQRSDNGDFNSGYVTIPIDDGVQEAYLDSVGAAATTRYYRIRATTGTTNAPHATKGYESAVISAVSGAGGTSYDGGTDDDWRGRCVALGTVIEPLGGLAYTEELHDETHWIEIWTADGHKLRGSLEHPVFVVNRGLTELIEVNVGDNVITKDGESKVTTHFHIEAPNNPEKKVCVRMEKGHLFWANGVLSHNKEFFVE